MNYKYPHFNIWQQYISPIEVAFVILYTKAKDYSFVPISVTDRPGAIVIEDDETSDNFSWSAEPDNPNNEFKVPGIEVKYSWDGVLEGGHSGSYHEEAESPTRIITSIEIESMEIYDPEIDDFIELKDNMVDYSLLGFKYQDMLDLAYVIGLDFFDYDELNNNYVEKACYRVNGKMKEGIPAMKFPLKLEEKIKSIINDRKFKTRITARKYGL